MKLDELFKLICPDEYKNIPIRILHLDSVYDLNEKSPMSFVVIDEEERIKYESSDKESFRGSTEYLLMYDLDIKHYYKVMKEKDEAGIYDLIVKRLKKYIGKIPEEYVIGCHMCLHELGHFQQYVDMDRKVYDYTQWCLEETKQNYLKEQVVHCNIQNRIGYDLKKRIESGTLKAKSNININVTKKEKIELINLAKEYRKIPKEKNADQFAYERISEAVSKVYAYLVNN